MSGRAGRIKELYQEALNKQEGNSVDSEKVSDGERGINPED